MSGELKRRHWGATLAAASVGVQVGVATVASRFVLNETDPFTLGGLRYLIGVLVLLPALVMLRRVGFERRDLLPMSLLGLLQFAVLIALFNIALTYAPAARVALVFATFPLLTMIFAWGLGKEQLTVWKVTGMLLTFAGVAIVLSDRIDATAGEHAGIGDLCAFGAAGCGALCSVLYRPFVRRYSSLAVGAFAMAVSAVALLAISLATGGIASAATISARGWAAVVFVGASSGAGFWALLWAYGQIAATRVAVFQALAPLVASALGVAILGETLGLRFIIGLGVVCFGIAVAHREVRPQ